MIEAIVSAVAPRHGDALVEIGPGLGALTAPLLARAGALTVIELDRDLAARLRGRAGLEVIEADVLEVDMPALAAGVAARAAANAANIANAAKPAASPAGALRIVGNLPYNISTPILFHLLPSAGCVRDQHFMLQREVVQRMAASPGGKDYGRLSVMLQWRYRIETVLEVPPAAFTPPPKVDSAVVRMVPRDERECAEVPQALLGELVTCAFSQRRKLLRHTLGRWLQGRGYAGSFDLQRRAEEVPVSEFLALAAALSASA